MTPATLEEKTCRTAGFYPVAAGEEEGFMLELVIPEPAAPTLRGFFFTPLQALVLLGMIITGLTEHRLGTYAAARVARSR